MSDHLPLTEQHPPLTPHEAFVESNRCLNCFDAPCTHACPTHIDIPRFIKKIATANLTGSARTILESNLVGATCARVCPVQELCEGACVLNSEHNPIMIGRLQRHAMDHVTERRIDVFKASPITGRQIAVIGAGPAGLSCAGELARRGHDVTIFEKRELGGGLSTYGIIVLREPVPVALEEVEMIKRLGVKLVTGSGFAPEQVADYDAVFLATGLGASPDLGIPGEDFIVDGLRFIEQSKMGLEDLHVGETVVVIGAGNTAVDCATVAKRCGAKKVTMVYRRTEKEMACYAHEYEFVKNEGVEFAFLAQPLAALSSGLQCIRMELGEVDSTGRPSPIPIPGSGFLIEADQIIKAIGQQKTTIAALFGLATDRGYVKVGPNFETSRKGIFAGGDSIRAKGSASTVMAAQDGKLAAAAIHSALICGAGDLVAGGVLPRS